MAKRTSHPLYLTTLALLALVLLTACGGGGSDGTTATVTDNDADGIDNVLDNCPDIANPAQTDTDGDGSGNACDGDNDDGDSFPNSSDVDDDNDGLIEITTLEQLDWMRNDLAGTALTDFAGTADNTGCPSTGCNGYELVTDLDFDTNGDGLMDADDRYYDYDTDNTDNGWLPIGSSSAAFTANFDGNGHRILNLYINRSNIDSETGGSYIGLLGRVDGGAMPVVIHNIVLGGALMNITGNVSTGGLIGYATNSVTISNNSASGDVTGFSDTGGLVGSAYNTVTISNSSASGDVSGTRNSACTGGLVGCADGLVTISNSRASGRVGGDLNSSYIGGLVGQAGRITTISNSRTTGNVEGIDSDYVGGLVGSIYSSVRITGSYATGRVESFNGSRAIGGLVGTVNVTLDETIQNNPVCFIDGSFATGKVGGAGYVGGLIGISANTELSTSFATGSVTGGLYVGGLVGDANVNTTIAHSYAAGSTTGTHVGNLVGWSDGANYTSSYFANDRGTPNAIGTNNSTGAVNPAGTTDVTLAELQCPTTANDTACVTGTTLYNGWDAVTDASGIAYWDFGSNTQLPGLLIEGNVYRDGNGDGALE